jgi:hypothetical protein
MVTRTEKITCQTKARVIIRELLRINAISGIMVNDALLYMERIQQQINKLPVAPGRRDGRK